PSGPMNKPEVTHSGSTMSSLARQSAAFVHDFADFAGWSGIWAASLAVLGAALEGVGLLLLVPILSIVTASESGNGWAHTILVRGLGLVGAQTRTAHLAVLLALFAALSRLATGFVEGVRGRLPTRLAPLAGPGGAPPEPAPLTPPP